ncbi:MAG: peptidase C1 [Bacteroidales bacterium]|nr:peptidase C1 [Bacteroidales bacterium]
MTSRKIAAIVISGLIFFIPVNAQNKDKAVYLTPKPGFYQNSILKDDRDITERLAPPPERKIFTADLSGYQLPAKVELYTNKQWHNPPVSQGNTNTCWCFSATSFLESETYRISKIKVKLSVMYTVYWEYVEKAKRFVEKRGESDYNEGSEANAVTRMWKKYGIIPEDAYPGLPADRKFHNHEAMIKEMKTYLESVKSRSAWDEDAVVAAIKSIMKHYMGAPPTEVTVAGKKMNPLQYLHDVLRINPDDYVDILSYRQEPFYVNVEYKVPDNWWHSTDYFNVPLDIFMDALKKAIHNGYTVSIGGDVSEPGFDRQTQCAIVPDFDIPSSYINDDARQFRFSNQTTTDDHGMHLVGSAIQDGKEWFLIKDSGSGSRNNDPSAPEFGYYFFSEDYVKLKMMDFTVHKDAVKDLLTKFK